MIRLRAQLAALAVGAALLAGVGCGSDEEEEPAPGIPRAAAQALSRELDLIEARIDVTREQSKPGSCGDIESKSYPDIQRILAGIPDDTDPDVRRALEGSIDRLKELADSECSQLVQEIEEREEDAPAPLPTPPPAPVQPPQTTPEPAEPKPKEEKPKDEEKKPEEPEQDGQDKGDGGVGPDGQGPPGQGGGGQPAPPAGDGG